MKDLEFWLKCKNKQKFLVIFLRVQPECLYLKVLAYSPPCFEIFLFSQEKILISDYDDEQFLHICLNF